MSVLGLIMSISPLSEVCDGTVSLPKGIKIPLVVQKLRPFY